MAFGTRILGSGFLCGNRKCYSCSLFFRMVLLQKAKPPLYNHGLELDEILKVRQIIPKLAIYLHIY